MIQERNPTCESIQRPNPTPAPTEVVMFHVADQLVGERMHISDFEPIGRLGFPSVYCRTADRFEVQRATYQQ